MIDFSTLQGLTIPEGVVTQITDASGRVLWMLNVGEPIILEVEKITSNTYVSSTSYTDEQFILLDIYPKTSTSTVKVTYGDLTKTLTFSGTNAQQVYFGTFGGVSDSVTTPASGTLTIEGDCIGIASGTYNTEKSTTAYCACITQVTAWGSITTIPEHAFDGCADLTFGEQPTGVQTIGDYAFMNCLSLGNITLGKDLSSINWFYVFGGGCLNMARIDVDADNEAYCSVDGIVYTKDMSTLLICPSGTSLTSFVIPSNVTSIGVGAFSRCYGLLNITVPSNVTSIDASAFFLNTIDSNNARTVTMLSTTPPTLASSNAFNTLGMNNIVVPKGCGDTYKAAEVWSELADYITEAS